jgi:hypothetical protein
MIDPDLSGMFLTCMIIIPWLIGAYHIALFIYSVFPLRLVWG